MFIPVYYILVLLMLLMGAGMSFSIYLARTADNHVRRMFAYVLLDMMTGMVLGPFILLAYPGRITVPDTIEITFITMAVLLAPSMAYFLRAIMQDSIAGSRNFIVVFTAFFIIFDEIVMSLDFNLFLSPVKFHNLLFTDTLSSVAYSVSTYWFVIPMGIEMVLSILYVRRSLGSFSIVIFSVQAVSMILAPAAFKATLWVPVAVYLSGAVMTGFFVFLFEHLYRKMSIHQNALRYLLYLLTAYSVMMAGVFLWMAYHTYLGIAAGMIFDMIIYIRAATYPGYLNSGTKIFWLAKRNWSFLFLLMIFVSEFFMGAVFDLEFYGPSRFMSSLSLQTISGSFIAMMEKSLFDFFYFFSIVSLSTWFLVMMGIEMGSLVVFKIMKTRELETRIRLVLMLFAYGVYSILIPSFLVPDSSLFPFIGWTMGIGSGGGLAPYLIIPMLVTYLISGILSYLFGSRQLCSVFCTAPVMYQGTFYDSMKKFNTSSDFTKKLTYKETGRNPIYSVVSKMVYFSVIAAGIVSYLDSTGYLRLTFYGVDPEYMLYLFYFGFLWYAVFITMPFFGSYGCIKTGYCHWGNFNRFISKFGFFRLKVRDPNQCINCKTKDCATACPVGNHSQPGNFIEKGEYKDSRCIGIGDCVDACPYENIFYYDVRHWLKEKISNR